MSNVPSPRWFPCPVCALTQDVRGSKTGKPYIICNTCGVQVFVRGKAGIAAFDQLVDRARLDGTYMRMNEMIRRYYVRCPACRNQFWIQPDLIVTSLFDGSLKGVRCPNATCKAVRDWEKLP